MPTTLVSTRSACAWGHNRVGQLGAANEDVVPRNEARTSCRGRAASSRSRGASGASSPAGATRHWTPTAPATSRPELPGPARPRRPRGVPHNERGHPYQPTSGSSRRSRKRVAVACGGEHSVALTADGEVCSCSAGSRASSATARARTGGPRLVARLRRRAGRCSRSRAATARSSAGTSNRRQQPHAPGHRRRRRRRMRRAPRRSPRGSRARAASRRNARLAQPGRRLVVPSPPPGQVAPCCSKLARYSRRDFRTPLAAIRSFPPHRVPNSVGGSFAATWGSDGEKV